VDPRTARTREALLDAAQALFAERGYDAVATRELAEAAGANLAAITYHFGGKRELYLETLRVAMNAPEALAAWSTLDRTFKDALDAARALVTFVESFLPRLLADDEARTCSQLMIREAMRPSDALPDVLAHFVVPRNKLLSGAVRAAQPSLSPTEAQRCASSILGQLLHVHLFRSFQEGMRGAPYDARDAKALVHHIAVFSLRGLGLSEARIARALAGTAKRAAGRRTPKS